MLFKNCYQFQLCGSGGRSEGCYGLAAWPSLVLNWSVPVSMFFCLCAQHSPRMGRRCLCVFLACGPALLLASVAVRMCFWLAPLPCCRLGVLVCRFLWHVPQPCCMMRLRVSQLFLACALALCWVGASLCVVEQKNYLTSSDPHQLGGFVLDPTILEKNGGWPCCQPGAPAVGGGGGEEGVWS